MLAATAGSRPGAAPRREIGQGKGRARLFVTADLNTTDSPYSLRRERENASASPPRQRDSASGDSSASREPLRRDRERNRVRRIISILANDARTARCIYVAARVISHNRVRIHHRVRILGARARATEHDGPRLNKSRRNDRRAGVFGGPRLVTQSFNSTNI